MLRMCVFTCGNLAAPLSVIAVSRGQPVARRATSSMFEIPSKCSFGHFQHQTLIQSWMCALTVQRREVAWFQMRMALPLREARPHGLA